jgi:hypothetical protein
MARAVYRREAVFLCFAIGSSFAIAACLVVDKLIAACAIGAARAL